MRQVETGELIRGHSQLFGSEQNPVPECLPNRAVLLPASRVNVQRAGQKREAARRAELPHQKEVLHQTCLREFTKRFKDFPPQEDALVSECQAGAADSQRIPGFQKTKRRPASFDPLAEHSARNAIRPKGLLHLLRRAGRKPAVSVEKQQRVACRLACPEILLNRTASRRLDQTAIQFRDQFPCPVRAASVHDKNLVRRKFDSVPNGITDDCRLIQGRNDNRKFH